MAGAILGFLRQSLPDDIAHLAEPYIAKLESGNYESLLRAQEAQELLGHVNDSRTNDVTLEDFHSWNDFIFHRLGILTADRRKPENQSLFFCIGYAALLAFIQSNVTGPPLAFASAKVLFPQHVAADTQRVRAEREALLASLGMDGVAAYRLTPNVELLCLADAIFTCPPILKYIEPARWAKLRVAFLQQRLLSEISSSLQEVIYDDLDLLRDSVLKVDRKPTLSKDVQVEFLIERATIHILHGLDKLAREDLETAKRERYFDFALTGLLGKRTRFQEKEVSQLVVLARSAEEADISDASSLPDNVGSVKSAMEPKPTTVDLEDDTLLDSISFSREQSNSIEVVDAATLPKALSSLDPSSQPQLHPLDSATLLALASTITNTSPQDGLTREETLPYATRVLEGGSSNWQVYTQALLTRSRIEGYISRTVERGLLQLQALVDQVITDTTTNSADKNIDNAVDQATTFLPRPEQSESASAVDRLRYVFQLASPYRWDLEAELASRWAQLGGFRSALDIYERLEMWAEAALCWAATEREDKAKRIVRRQLFHAAGGDPGESKTEDEENQTWTGPARDPPPPDAPRLYCILGDIDQSPDMYEKAWDVSNQRYAQAQRSLGRYYFARKDFTKAADAYRKSLQANQLHGSSWFALGCALLELADFTRAVEAFSRCVQLDDNDAEAWSNLAAALLRKGSVGEEESNGSTVADRAEIDEDFDETKNDARSRELQNRRDALRALKRAATLKHDSYRIWENVLIVSASVSPPDYATMLAAQKNIIGLRASTVGEKCIDVAILDRLVQYVISLSNQYDPSQPGLQRMTVKFMDENVAPLITGSAELWRLISRLALWRNRPSSALDAEEKAWRVITSQPGWETESEARWNEVVEATVRLCDAYESLGSRERTEGLAAGEPVAKDWNFKSRTAIRGILGRGKGSWEGTEGWEKLKDTLEGLKR